MAPRPVSSDTDTTVTAPTARLPRWRRILVGFLVVLGCILAPLSVLSVWTKTTLLDTDRYVSTVAPLSDDPDVEQALANRITNAIVQNTDIESKIADALPSKAAFVAPAVARGLEQYVNRPRSRSCSPNQFDKLWKDANARAHPQIVALLEGKEGKRLSTKNGEIVLTLGPIAEKVQGVLDKAGVDVFTNTSGPPQIVLFSSSELKSAEGATNLLQKSAWVLPFLTILAFAVAIALSGNRRRTVLRASLGIAFGLGAPARGLEQRTPLLPRRAPGDREPSRRRPRSTTSCSRSCGCRCAPASCSRSSSRSVRGSRGRPPSPPRSGREL